MRRPLVTPPVFAIEMPTLHPRLRVLPRASFCYLSICCCALPAVPLYADITLWCCHFALQHFTDAVGTIFEFSSARVAITELSYARRFLSCSIYYKYRIIEAFDEDYWCGSVRRRWGTAI